MTKNKGMAWIGAALVCSLLIACGKVAPQRPSQRSGEKPKEDSTTLALMEMNQRMAIEADKEVLAYAQKQEEAYSLMDISNTWLLVQDKGEGDAAPKEGEQWEMHICTRTLQGKLLCDVEQTYTIGKSELVPCIEIAIDELRHGERLVMVAPWYAAYGMHGNENVPPYTNVILEIEIK